MERGKKNRGDAKGATRMQRGLEERGSWWDKLLDLSTVWAVIAVVGCTWILLPREGHRLPEWQAGDVAAYDLMVPRDMTLPDEAATEAVRQEARAAVLPVYDQEPRLQYEQADKIRALFAVCRELAEAEVEGLTEETLLDADDLVFDPGMRRILTDSDCDAGLEEALLNVVAQVYRMRIVDDKRALERRAQNGVSLRNLASATERVVTLDELSGVIDFRSEVEPAVRTLVLEEDVVVRRWIKSVVDFLASSLAADIDYNRAETASRIDAAAEEVTPRSQVLRKGQILVRRGDTVSVATARTLRVVNSQRQDVVMYTGVAGIGMLMTMIVFGWWSRLGRIATGSVERRSRLSMIFILLLLFVALNRVGMFVAAAIALNSQGLATSTVTAYIWGLPFAAGSMAVLLLLGVQPAVLFSLCISLSTGVMLGGDFRMGVYALVSSLVGVVAAQRYKERTGFSRIALLVGVANLAALLMLKLYGATPESLHVLALSAFCAFLGGALSIGVVSFVLPLLEGIFSITTDIRLLELSNQNLPLLKRLSLEAPGTYQHSLAVGNLAEAGADVVGANSLLLRVCAYYHDLGKVVKPEYFVENQRGTNPHDSLSPSMSALVIQSHVKEGLELARKAKLPMAVRQAVATHHGTKLIRYFYNKAKEQCDPDVQEVRESYYRYPGPKPHTKELGILLLADAVEAAARTLENPTPSKIQSMINKIFTDALEDGQLDDSELTFSELDKVASAFIWVLTNMYHHRIDYPGFDFNRRQNKRDSGILQVGPKAIAGER